MARDPGAVYRLEWWQMEELTASRYRAYDRRARVTLTPRSGDGGRDIIVEQSDFPAIRILDQVKLSKPGHLVPANDVRAMFGVLVADPRASKAYVTTTSDFAPGVYQEFADRMPTRMELRNGAHFYDWLTAGHTTNS